MAKRKKTTQSQLLFYLLLMKYRSVQDKDKVPYVPLWTLMVEHYIDKFQEWTFMSYEISTTMSKLKAREPKLFQSIPWQNKNGSTSIAYRLNSSIKPSDIQSDDIKQFYSDLAK